MRTKAVRIYGKKDLRLEDFELPSIGEDEILAKVISDSICMSSYKASIQGAAHKRVPDDIEKHPTIIGHEFCGVLEEVGPKWQHKFKKGDHFAIQPALNYKGSLDAPGYSFRYIGGNATYVVIPNEVMEMNCLLKYDSDVFYFGSLAEPMSCIVGGYHACYHTTGGSYVHKMGIKEGGKLAILAGVGPMGLGAIDYALHAPRRPAKLVVTDIDDARLARAASIYTVEEAKRCGVELIYLNTGKVDDPVKALMKESGGTGYDDVFVYAPVRAVIEQGDKILGSDGCLNFFAGPTDPEFSAMFNFYNVHYASTHIVGTSGGNTDDLVESIHMMNSGQIDPSAMITHIGGLNAVIETTLNLPNIPGGKKLIYNHIELPLTAIEDFGKIDDPLFKALDKIVSNNNGLWCGEAEKYLLANAKPIE